MSLAIAVIVAATVSNGGVYGAVVQSLREQLASIPKVRVFVAQSTDTVSDADIRKLEAMTAADSGERPIAAHIRSHAAYRAMLLRSARPRPLGTIAGAELVRREPLALRCEGVNWELSRDVVMHFGGVGYAADGSEAVVFATVRDCISSANLLLLLQRKEKRWRIEEQACLSCAGE